MISSVMNSINMHSALHLFIDRHCCVPPASTTSTTRHGTFEPCHHHSFDRLSHSRLRLCRRLTTSFNSIHISRICRISKNYLEFRDEDKVGSKERLRESWLKHKWTQRLCQNISQPINCLLSISIIKSDFCGIVGKSDE